MTSPVTPNVQREATEARIYLKRAIFHLQKAISAARSDGQDAVMLSYYRLRAEQLFRNMTAWRNHQGNGGGATVGESSATLSPTTNSPAAIQKRKRV